MKTGTVEAAEESVARERLQQAFENVELEDQGPIYFYTVVEGIWQKATAERYDQAQKNKESSLKAYPSDEGRKWEVYMPAATGDILYNVHQLIEGEVNPDSEGGGPQEVTVVGIPPEMMGHPAMGQIIGQMVGSRRPGRFQMDEQYKMGTRDLMNVFMTHAQLTNVWFQTISKAQGPFTADLLKEFKLMTREYRRVLGELMTLGVENMNTYLPPLPPEPPGKLNNASGNQSAGVPVNPEPS